MLVLGLSLTDRVAAQATGSPAGADFQDPVADAVPLVLGADLTSLRLVGGPSPLKLSILEGDSMGNASHPFIFLDC